MESGRSRSRPLGGGEQGCAARPSGQVRHWRSTLMQRRLRRYNADIGMYVINSRRWGLPREQIHVMHFTLGPIKPWQWYAPWVSDEFATWQAVRARLDAHGAAKVHSLIMDKGGAGCWPQEQSLGISYRAARQPADALDLVSTPDEAPCLETHLPEHQGLTRVAHVQGMALMSVRRPGTNALLLLAPVLAIAWLSRRHACSLAQDQLLCATGWSARQPALASRQWGCRRCAAA